jgi:hypothetical protein
VTKGFFIRDDELRGAGVSELDIDALDRDLRTQKGIAHAPTDARHRPAVEEVLAARGVTVELK